MFTTMLTTLLRNTCRMSIVRQLFTPVSWIAGSPIQTYRHRTLFSACIDHWIVSKSRRWIRSIDYMNEILNTGKRQNNCLPGQRRSWTGRTSCRLINCLGLTCDLRASYRDRVQRNEWIWYWCVAAAERHEFVHRIRTPHNKAQSTRDSGVQGDICRTYVESERVLRWVCSALDGCEKKHSKGVPATVLLGQQVRKLQIFIITQLRYPDSHRTANKRTEHRNAEL